MGRRQLRRAAHWQMMARIVLGAALVSVMAAAGGVGTRAGAPARAAQESATLANAELPPELGQNAFAVYVPQTGHTVSGMMLDYWRATGAASTYGLPISEPFVSAGGLYSQAFERGVLQYRPDYLYTAEPIMGLMPVSQRALTERLGTVRADGRRGAGGGDRRASAWRPVDPFGETAAIALANGGSYFDTTAHTLSGEFLAWYGNHEGSYYLGAPVSEPLAERGALVQYFEGGLLTVTPSGAAMAPLVAESAAALGIDTTPVGQGGLPDYDELLFWQAPNPNPQGDPYAPGAKRIEISISQQQLWAYQGDTLITTTLISTGKKPNETELGRFHVRIKYPEQDMAGFTDDTGEVVAFGEDARTTPAPDNAERYDVEDVPHVMYFNLDAEALHGAYWHENFGQRMSHGCVNLPLEMAAFLYGWAPLGTPVWVHE